MPKKQHYMTRDERYQLEALREAGVPVAQIARQLGFCKKTIYNELHRGAYHRIVLKSSIYRDEIHYSAEKAQQITDYNQTGKGRPMKIGSDQSYADYLERKMLGIQPDGSTDKRKRFSPAAALADARAEGFSTTVCTSTLYSYIDKGIFLNLTNKNLWIKGNQKKRSYEPVQRIAHPKLPSITQRPQIINSREEQGHWEMDLVVGRKGSKPVLLTLSNRKSREEMIFKLPNRQASTIRGVFDQMERNMPDFRKRFKSITTDNGSEFLQYEELTKSIYGGKRFEVYYCHSYAAWEKGTNENHNRMIRRWFPKGTDFSRVTKKEIAELQDWMNGYPRKILNWARPADIAL